MKKEELTRRVKELGMSKKEFANLVGLSYSTVCNWSDQTKPIPKWMVSWLDNYTYKAKFEEIQRILKKKLV